MGRHWVLRAAVAAVVVAGGAALSACGSGGDDRAPVGQVEAPGLPGLPPLRPTGDTDTSRTAQGPVRLQASEVVTGLDTPWSLVFDSDGRLWFTERPGRVTRLGDPPQAVEGVAEQTEAGLFGITFDRAGRRWLYYSTATDNRIVRYDGATARVMVSGLRRAQIHDGGRLALGPDGAIYAGTGDAAQQDLAQNDQSLNGKILRIDPDTGDTEVFSKGHRNVQGLCFDANGRFLSTEHGPDRGDEINDLHRGDNGGWPQVTGNGIKNWTPTIAPAGCAVYNADLIPGWKGSMLFVTLKDQDLRRLTFNPDGSVAGEEILFDTAFGRLRDVVVGPDGAVYVATSNQDGRGRPASGDDRILRIAPAP
jgi:glucose/arabinose dehydrogenase